MHPDYGSAQEQDPTSFNMVRSGTVVDRRLTNVGGQVKVFYKDRGVTTDWLPVGQSGSKGHVFYMPPPQINDQVTVLHYGTGIERGIVACTNNTPLNQCFKPRSIDAVALQSIDGSYFEYDPTTGCLSINGVDTVFLKAEGQIQITTAGDLDATVSGNLNATVSGDLNANVTGNTTVTSHRINLNGVIIDSTGNVTLPQGMTLKSDLFAGSTTTPIANPRMTNLDSSGGGS